MTISDNIKLSLSSIRDNLLRSILTMVIIAFGIMALVGILTAIDAILGSLSSSFSGLGANSYAISPNDESFGPRRRGMRREAYKVITYDQATEFADRFSTQAKVSINAAAFNNSTVVFDTKKTNPNINVLGINENYLEASNMNISVGRGFSTSEFQFGSNVCILGSDLISLLFSGNEHLALDKSVSIDGNKFRVVGVLQSKGSSMTSSGDRQVFIPLLTQKKYFATQNQNYNLLISVPLQTNLEESSTQAIGLFRNIRRLRVIDKDDFVIEKSDAILRTLEENTATIRIATVAIGFITLIGASIGLMNIMLVSVTDRTREIGIRKALGATRRNILMQFLLEAIVICQIGGIVGIVLGIGAGNIISLFTKSSFLIPWPWITLGIITCFIVGLVAGIYPAIKAAKLDPVESLRYE